MPKTKISEFSANPANNTDIDGINIAEGCAPSGINDAIRELMAQLKDWQAGTSGDTMIINATDNSNAALRITQLGTGNALLVEDSSNPDASPFVVDAAGRTVIGYTANITSANLLELQSAGASTNYAFGFYGWNSGGGFPIQNFYRSKSGTVGTQGIVASGDSIGALRFFGDDGTAFIRAAEILSVVDGTPGTNDMPGRLVFSTTADGASSPTERMRINSSGQISTGIAGTAALPSFTRTGDENTGIFFPAADTIAFSEGGTESMRIDSSGNVGIGTSSPYSGSKADVQIASSTANYAFQVRTFDAGTSDGSTTAKVFRTVNSGGGNWANAQYDAWAHIWTRSGTERMRLDSDGNLGIGTSSPGAKLHVNGASLLGSSTFYVGDDGGSLGAFLNQSAATPIRFLTSGSERARIDSSGNLLVGTTSNGTNSRLRVASTAQGIDISVANNGSNYITNTSGTASYNAFVFANNGQTYSTCGTIAVSGSNTSYNTGSDYRLKENIAPMTGALSKVALLKPCTFKWKSTGNMDEGFIAHELQEVCPSAVNGEKDAVDAEGKPVYQGIDTSFLVATLTAAIQEQQALITALTARVAALESN